MKKTPLECLGSRETGLRWPRGWQHLLPRAAGDTCSLKEPAALGLLHYTSLGALPGHSANEGQKQLTAVTEEEPRAHSSGEGHKGKLLPSLIGFLPHAAGSWNEEILVLQHLDMK